MHAIEGALRKSDRPATDVRQIGATDAPTTRPLTRQVLVSASFIYTSSLGRILPKSVHDQIVPLPGVHSIFGSKTASGALSAFTLAPETPPRRFCRMDKSAHVHRFPKRLSVRA